MAESKHAVNNLIRLPGIRDEPGEDGLTGFAIALGMMNAKLSISILSSNVEPRDNILFLAQEVLHVNPDGDNRISGLQKSIKEALKEMSVPDLYCLEPSIEQTGMGLERVAFPMVNSEIEKEARYFKNKIWQKENLRENMSKSKVYNDIEADILKPLVLDKFCIESNSIVKWAVNDIKIVSCTHEGDRYTIQKLPIFS